MLNHLCSQPRNRAVRDVEAFANVTHRLANSSRIRSPTSVLTGATPEALPLCSCTREAQVDAAANDRPLELGECASYPGRASVLSASWCRCAADPGRDRPDRL